MLALVSKTYLLESLSTIGLPFISQVNMGIQTVVFWRTWTKIDHRVQQFGSVEKSAMMSLRHRRLINPHHERRGIRPEKLEGFGRYGDPFVY